MTSSMDIIPVMVREANKQGLELTGVEIVKLADGLLEVAKSRGIEASILAETFFQEGKAI